MTEPAVNFILESLEDKKSPLITALSIWASVVRIYWQLLTSSQIYKFNEEEAVVNVAEYSVTFCLSNL